MNLDVYNTHMELYPYAKDDYPIIEDMYTATDKFSGNEFACGYLIDDGKLYLPRGTHIGKIEAITGAKVTYNRESDPVSKMSRKHYSIYDPRNKVQEESIKFLQGPEHQLALNLATGVGKGEPYNRKIPTPTPQGWTRMGDLKVGDKVFGKDGLPTTILKIFELGEKEIFKIQFNDGRYALCTDEHLWDVKSYKEGVYRTRKTIDLYHEYIDNGAKENLFFKKYIPVNECVQYPKQNVPIHPWILGLFIGNGCLCEQALTISSGTEEIPERIAKLYKWRYKRSSLKNYSYVFYDDNNKRISTKEFFKNLPEMVGKQSYNKYIPDIYLYNDYETRIQLLQGLMDTDGSISYNEGRYHTTYSSCSRKLLEQIQQLLFMNGFRGNIINDKRVEKYRNGYHGKIIFNIPNNRKHELFTLSYKSILANKAKYTSQRDIYNDLRIESISIVDKQLSRCIMVDNSDHLYLTQDYIVTHNTFCVAYAITELQEKALIITPNESLKQQWISTFSKMFDYRSKDLINIAGSNIIDAFMEDLIDEAEIYFVNHQTLRSYLTSTNGYALHKFFKKLNTGIKVYDESHMEFMNILLTDFFSNTNRTWYLTATFDRSDKTESVCFKRAFNSVIAYGEMQSQEIVRKHVIYHVVNINSRISPKDRAKIIGYSGMTSASYGKYAFLEDENNTAYNAILEILKKIKNVEGKILIFVPLIEAVDEVVKKLRKDYPDKSVGAYHSKITKDEKESVEKKDIIVSTIKSLGTGKDIKGLRCVICAEPVASKVIIQQVIGRLRPYADDKDTYYFDIVDICIPPINWWFRGRFKKIETLVKQVVYLNIEK